MVKHWARLLLVIVALFLAFALDQIQPSFLAPIKNALYDLRINSAIRLREYSQTKEQKDTLERRVIIIDIDEQSVSREGAWPWPRDKVANLLKVLIDEYQVSALALDIVFPEKRVGDFAFAEQMARQQVTGAVVFDMQGRDLPALAHQLPNQAALTVPPHFPLFFGKPTTANHAGITGLQVGHITPLIDADGVIRRVPPFICASKQLSTCTSLLELSAFGGLVGDMKLAVLEGRSWFDAPWEVVLQSQAAGVIARLPLSADGSVAIPFRHRSKEWMAISATEVLQKKADASVLKGAVVIVGSTALGMADVVATPTESEGAGVVPHAEIMSALFDQDFPYQPRAAYLLVLLLSVPLLLLLPSFVRNARHGGAKVLLYPLWLLFSWGYAYAALCLIYSYFKWQLPLLPLFLFPPLALVAASLFDLYRVDGEQRALVRVLATYLPRQVADRLANLGEAKGSSASNMDAAHREITVLFADIRGFTGIVENNSAETVAMITQEVFARMASAVVDHGGTIDKFIGDAIMAFWNAPSDDPLHAQHALEAAFDMCERIDGLSQMCAQLQIDRIEISVGIETGMALVGHFGSHHRRTYTALGEPIVLASRIEGITSIFERCVLVGPGCASQLPAGSVQNLGETSVRGRRRKIEIFAPVKNSLEAPAAQK